MRDPIRDYQHMRNIRWSKRTHDQWVALMEAADRALGFALGMADGYQKRAAELQDEVIGLRTGFDLAIEQRDEAEHQVEVVQERYVAAEDRAEACLADVPGRWELAKQLRKAEWMLDYALTHDLARENQHTKEAAVVYMDKLYSTESDV